MKREGFFTVGVLVLFLSMFYLASETTSASGPNLKNVTFTKDVAPIFYRECVQCHRPNDLAPMSLLTYKEARPWARSIRKKVVSKQMPPWHADPVFGEFINDARLKDEEIAIIDAWVKNGAKRMETVGHRELRGSTPLQGR